VTLLSILLVTCLVSDPTIAQWIDRNGVEVIERKDLSPAAAASSPSSPGIVVAKFRADDAVNAALLRKVKDQVLFQIVACPDRANCSVAFEQDVSRYSRITYLEKVPKGTTLRTTESAEAQRTTKLRDDGVRVNYFEKAAVVYFWDSGMKAWESIGVSD